MLRQSYILRDSQWRVSDQQIVLAYMYGLFCNSQEVLNASYGELGSLNTLSSVLVTIEWSLRNMYIHGTSSEHFMRMRLNSAICTGCNLTGQWWIVIITCKVDHSCWIECFAILWHY